MIAHRFTCGERKIAQNIKKPQNIMKMTEDNSFLSANSIFLITTVHKGLIVTLMEVKSLTYIRQDIPIKLLVPGC